jgi:hypothetical protein
LSAGGGFDTCPPEEDSLFDIRFSKAFFSIKLAAFHRPAASLKPETCSNKKQVFRKI